MASSASTAKFLASNVCYICQKRGREIESAFCCFECKLSLCTDCTFTHSWIPSCETHKTNPARTDGPERVDVQRKPEDLDSLDECLKSDDWANVDIRENTEDFEEVDVRQNTMVSDSKDGGGNKKVFDSVEVCPNSEGLGSVEACRNKYDFDSFEVCQNTEGVDACRNEEAADNMEEGSLQFILESMFNPAREEDKEKPDIRAVLLLECGIILAADWANCTLKSFDMDGRFLGDCHFKKSGVDAGRIHGIALKDANTVYVTLPSLKKIASIAIDRINDGIKFTKTLYDTTRRYIGIAHMAKSKKLIVGTTNSVDILSYQCKVLSEMDQFSKPYNMGAESPGSVLVSDTENNCLYRIGVDDTVEEIYVGMKNRQLRGVTVDRRGNIFFAAMLELGVGVASDGEPIRWILTDRVQKVIGVHYQQTHTGHWLVVSEKDGDIKLFRIK